MPTKTSAAAKKDSLAVRIGQRCRAERIARGWSQVELGGLSGLDNTAISRLERGRLESTYLSTVARIASALGLDVPTLIDGLPAVGRSPGEQCEPSGLAAMLGERCRRRRRQIGLSQVAVAQYASMWQTDYSEIERGCGTEIPLTRLAQVAEALATTPGDLLRGTTLPPTMIDSIRYDMQRQGLTARELSRRSGVQLQQLYGYLAGRREPTMRQLERLAKGLGKRWQLTE